ncbi:MAG: L,D-transpeptidase [Candidatus Cloacimonadota bacterium]|nr:MAG: L,D-transpeptidase [Candidatus Cloacimonadota bacterium]
MQRVENEIKVHISTQELHLYSGKSLIKVYPISTAKNGIGNTAGSNKTPLGLHEISKKIGKNAAVGSIFRSGEKTGKLAEINGENPDDDLITTRIMMLNGLEAGVNKGNNIDSFKRGIWIHGTPEEDKIGKPASHGCIRMKNKDICELFDLVDLKTPVIIVE